METAAARRRRKEEFLQGGGKSLQFFRPAAALAPVRRLHLMHQLIVVHQGGRALRQIRQIGTNSLAGLSCHCAKHWLCHPLLPGGWAGQVDVRAHVADRAVRICEEGADLGRVTSVLADGFCHGELGSWGKSLFYNLHLSDGGIQPRGGSYEENCLTETWRQRKMNRDWQK